MPGRARGLGGVYITVCVWVHINNLAQTAKAALAAALGSAGMSFDVPPTSACCSTSSRPQLLTPEVPETINVTEDNHLPKMKSLTHISK